MKCSAQSGGKLEPVCVLRGGGGGRKRGKRESRGLLHQLGQLEPDRSMLTDVHSLNLSLCSFELSGCVCVWRGGGGGGGVVKKEAHSLGK